MRYNIVAMRPNKTNSKFIPIGEFRIPPNCIRSKSAFTAEGVFRGCLQCPYLEQYGPNFMEAALLVCTGIRRGPDNNVVYPERLAPRPGVSVNLTEVINEGMPGAKCSVTGMSMRTIGTRVRGVASVNLAYGVADPPENK